MRFDSMTSLREDYDFTGFRPMKEIFKGHSTVDKVQGVYLVLYPHLTKPVFINPGTGAFLKGESPNVDTAILESRWVEDTVVLYIGKGGGDEIKATLQIRLMQYAGFGRGKKYAHRGGRYIWQIQNAHELVVCWKHFSEDPRTVEKRYIQLFKDRYGKPPFANING